MATDKSPLPFEFTASEREVLRSCIALKMTSVERARKTEPNPAVAELRRKEYDELAALQQRFR